jgi:phosphate:Na+ symporter
MDLFMVLQLLCGLALFLFGMNSMGDGLESLSGGKLEKTLEKMTNSTMKGFVLGAAVTAVIQSSSATLTNGCSLSSPVMIFTEPFSRL